MIIFVIAIATIFYPQVAHAYFDPGTGSLILQSIIGAFLVGTYTAKIYWFKIKKFFNTIFSKKKPKK